MTQKLVVGLLILTVIGAVIVGVYDAQNSDDSGSASDVLANVNDTNDAADTQAVGDDTAPVDAQAGSAPNAAVEAATTTDTTQAQAGEPVMAAVDSVGEAWRGSGSIAELDENGMTLTLSMTETVYVELGPPTAWQTADPTVTVGEFVTVQGFFNGEQYHAATVTKADGTQLLLRTAEGQPLWAGSNSAHSEDGTTTEPQVSADEWLTVEGVVTAVNNSMLTMQTVDGEVLDLQLGQPRFAEAQGITFAAGDEISVLGFWQGTTFKAGEIQKTATGERLMLLDPNGRPLWGGPGRNGAGGGQQTTTTDTTSPQGNAGQSNSTTASATTGNGGGNGGGGNGYQGGRNENFTKGNGGNGGGNNTATTTTEAQIW